MSTLPEPAPPSVDERLLVDALRRRDEAAFLALVERYHGSLLRMAATYVGGWAEAEEVVQDTWLAVLRGLERFEGRSSFRTWLFRILVNRARSRAERESRSVSLAEVEDVEEATVPASRFRPPDSPFRPRGWLYPPKTWEGPEEQLLSAELRRLVNEAIVALPPRQRAVITLRDIEGWAAEEVCNVLEVSESNQRVLLHRARSGVRARLENYFDPSEGRG